MLASAVTGIILLITGTFFFFRSDPLIPEKSFREQKKIRKISSAEELMGSLAQQAALLAEKKQYGKAAELYLSYKGPFEQETLEKRKILAQGYRITEGAFLTTSLQEDGQSADTGSDRSQ